MIILTGASGGLGSKLIKDLLLIDDVILIYNNNKIEYKGAFSFKLNVINENEVLSFIKSQRLKLKKITLVNMATYSKDGLLVNYTIENWKKTFDINVNGPFFLIKHLLPFMIADNWGRIINVSSYLASNGAKGASAYSSSKSALIGLTKSLSKEYGRFNINSNIMELGYFDGGLADSLDDQLKNNILKRIPTKKLGKIEEISSCISLLIDSSYINGTVLKINGGIN